MLNSILADYYGPRLDSEQSIDPLNDELNYTNVMQERELRYSPPEMNMEINISYNPHTMLYGQIGAVSGIIAGSIGIRMSYSKNLSQTMCLWRAYIAMIFINMMASAASFILVIIIGKSAFAKEPGHLFRVVAYFESVLLFGTASCIYNRIMEHF